MISRAEAIERKEQLDAAHAWTRDERAQLVHARARRDEAHAALLATRRDVQLARSRKQDPTSLEQRHREAVSAYADAFRVAGEVEIRLNDDRQARVRAVKAQHQAVDDERTRARIVATPPQRVRINDGERTHVFTSGSR